MTNAEVIIDFEGSISFETMEKLLNQLKSARQFNALRKPVRKRVYGTVVESIDNIFKYAAPVQDKIRVLQKPPMLMVKEQEGKFIVSTGNLLQNEQVDDLKYKLNRVNQMDDEALKSLYEEVINKEASDRDRGAGLGLITMALRTDGNICYHFDPAGPAHSYFTMHITVKE
ncbi:MAG: SiaB family protein kinase [Bacteroidales bacterium]|nr:SiaB family protein kinase [Bacteroidales bacterium]